jgi:predicted Fe-Mo cluster-binding NifX family protein
MKVAIPRFQEEVAPCFEYSATIAIFEIENGTIIDQLDFSLQSGRAFDRLRLLKDQQVHTLICGGIQDRFEDLVRASGIETISWVKGNVETILKRYLTGRLTPGGGRLGKKSDKTKKESAM